MSKLRKRIISSVSILTAGALLVTSLSLQNASEVQAQPSFNGIDAIIENNGAEKPFQVVELVPNMKMAEFGYLVEGNEPFFGANDEDERGIGWISKLKNTKSSASRVQLMNELSQKLALANVFGDAGFPISYTPYEETYIQPVDPTEWTYLQLDTPDVIEDGADGYTMQYVGIGNGSFDLLVAYDFIPDRTGDFDENPLYYVYSENGNMGRYGVKMEAISTSAETVEALRESLKDTSVYQAKVANCYMNAESFDAMRQQEGNSLKYVYMKRRSYLSSDPYTFVDVLFNVALSPEEMPEVVAEGEREKTLLDFDTNWYYIVEFEAVPNDMLELNKMYYTVADAGVEFAANAEYIPYLDPERPYISNPQHGYYSISGTPAYTYVGEGAGTYNLIRNVEPSPDPVGGEEQAKNNISINGIYYKGGFTNNQLFKNLVFNQDSALDSRSMYFTVSTKNPQTMKTFLEVQPGESELLSDNLPMDLLYISGRPSSLCDVADITSFGNDANSDIDWNVVRQIVKKVYGSNVCLPVVVDSSILTADSNVYDAERKRLKTNFKTNATNMQKLVALLMAENYTSIPEDVTDQDTISWENIKISSDSDADGFYVKRNVCIFPGNDATKAPFMLSSLGDLLVNVAMGDDSVLEAKMTAFENAAKSAGFGEIAEYINNENFLRKSESLGSGKKYTYFDLQISKAIALEYCISYFKKRVQTWDKKINVLAIEPGKVNSSNKDYVKTKIGNWFVNAGYLQNTDRDNITVTTLPMAEFIGKIDDLSNYDMLFFGLCIDQFNISGNSTVYNDSSMNGLIYTNVGDITFVNSKGSIGAEWPWSYSGLLETDYNHSGLTNGILTRSKVKILGDDTSSFKYDRWGNLIDYNITSDVESFRYSGNDITMQRYNDVFDYIKGGFPVVFEDGFLANDGSVNASKIDNSSLMYTLVEECFKDGKYENVCTSATAASNTARLFRYVSLNKPVLTTTVSGKTVVDTTVNPAKTMKYLEIDSTRISIAFRIDNYGSASATSSFDCILYLDSNADGRFSAGEAVSPFDLTISLNGKKISPDRNGKYALQAGSSNAYTLSYNLPDSYYGIIPWKLMVAQSDNKYRYDANQGYLYRRQTGSKQQIKILQITTADGAQGKSTFNMQDELSNDRSTFYRYAKTDLKDFELNIKTITATEYQNKYLYENGESFIRLDSGKVSMNDFDMLVLGFADVYKLDNTNNCFRGIQDFINSGKSVLCTHDTTSPSNDSKKTYWGYSYNTLLRNLVGMDRYAILENPALKIGLELDKNSNDYAYIQEASGQRYYVLRDGDGYKYATSSTGALKIKELYEDAVKYAQEHDTDLAYKPGSNKAIILKHNQGMANLSLAFQGARKEDNYSSISARTDNYVQYYMNGKVKSNSSYQLTTTVKRVNEGQITTYPYDLGETLTVANTHYQYYQLDMNEDEDGDGESDIVVWYSLDGSSNPLYSSTSGDVRNNYYIYTKGNITYSGVGHSKINNAEEMKLYVNTMIAAYSAGQQAPKVVLTQGNYENAATLNTIYVPKDLVVSDDDQRQNNNLSDVRTVSSRLYFSVNDSNLIRNMEYREEIVDFCTVITKEEYDAGRLSWNETDYLKEEISTGVYVYLKRIHTVDNPTKALKILTKDGAELPSVTSAEIGSDPTKNLATRDGYYLSDKDQYHLVSGVMYCVDLPVGTMFTEDPSNPAATKNIQACILAKTLLKLKNSDSLVQIKAAGYYEFRIQQIDFVDLD